MSTTEVLQSILLGEELSSKLLDIPLVTNQENESKRLELPNTPGRSERLAFSTKQIKFPRIGSFHQREQRAKALHFFANHELLAIEMMAYAYLKFSLPNKNDDLKFKKIVISTLKDEQKHLNLYLAKMKQYGIEFGDLPLNDYFWRQVQSAKTVEEYFAFVSLTIELANLDFSLFYHNVFKEVEDEDCAEIMMTIFKDEISHVHVGAQWLEKARMSKSLWDYYKELLPEKVTPARARGISFSREARIKAGLPTDFIDSLQKYDDDFRITKRKDRGHL